MCVGVSHLYLACCSSRPADELPPVPAERLLLPEDSSSLTGARGEAARGPSAGTSAVAAWGHVLTRGTGIRFRSLFIDPSFCSHSEIQRVSVVSN